MFSSILKSLRSSENQSKSLRKRSIRPSLLQFGSARELEPRILLSNVEGFEIVKDIYPGPGSSQPAHITRIDDDMFVFTANDGVHGTELWKTDLTNSGTTLIKDIHPGLSAADISDIHVLGDRFYFAASDGVNGLELWKSDGTFSGTMMVKDIHPGSGDSLSRLSFDVAELNGKLYFAADDGIHGRELWVTDGTEAGTFLVRDIEGDLTVGSDPRGFVVLGDTVYFAASDGIHGDEPWKSDGTEAGTEILKDIYVGEASSVGDFYQFTPLGGELFFPANDGMDGTELYRSDGTSAGTTIVVDLNAGQSSSFPANLTVVDSKLFFTAHTALDGETLWLLDESGVRQIADPDQGSNTVFLSLTSFNSKLFFSVNDQEHGYELWSSDGNETNLVADLNPGGASSDPRAFAVFVDQLLFSADNGSTGFEVYGTEGTSVDLVADLNPGPADSFPELYSFSDQLLGLANIPDHGDELIRAVVQNPDRGRITGIKFEDHDSDGVMDAGEPPLGGFDLWVDINGDLLVNSGEVQTTDEFGQFRFDNVPAGTHTLSERLSLSQTQTWAPTESHKSVSVRGGQTTAVEYGNVRLARLDIFKFNDIIPDGIRSEFEPLLSNWEFAVELNEFIDVRRTTSNLAPATFLLRPGTYTARELLQDGWRPTTGSPVGGVLNVTLEPGEHAELFFGNTDILPPAFIPDSSLTCREQSCIVTPVPIDNDEIATFQITVCGQNNECDQVVYQITDEVGCDQQQCDFPLPTTPVEGAKTIQTRVADRTGNLSDESLSFEIADKVVPNIKVTSSGKSLVVTGTSGDDAVTVLEIRPGVYRVTAVKGTVNGKAFFEVPGGTKNVVIRLRGGNNNLDVGSALSLTNICNLSITTGAGLDEVNVTRTLVNGKATVVTSKSADRVKFAQVTVKKKTKIALGGGDNRLTVKDSTFHDFMLTSGRGRDWSLLQTTSMNRGVLKSGGGRDRMKIKKVQADKLGIHTAGGADQIVIEAAILNAASIRSGSGDDIVRIDDSVLGSIFVFTEHGNDQLHIERRGRTSKPTSYKAANLDLGRDDDVMFVGRSKDSTASLVKQSGKGRFVANGGRGKDVASIGHVPNKDNLHGNQLGKNPKINGFRNPEMRSMLFQLRGTL